MSRVWIIIAALLLAGAVTDAQTRRTTKKPPPPARKATTAPADMTCPSPLGVGVTTKLTYCDVLTGRDPKEGIIIKLPSRRGPLTLKFKLHNRHTYSDEEVQMKRAFSSYTASIGLLTLDNTLLTRAVVASEFRKPDDLLERIGGGAGPGGVKAVAPIGVEAISFELPADVEEISVLGEKLIVVRGDGVPATYSASGRPIAVISDATVEYVPAPPPPARRSRPD